MNAWRTFVSWNFQKDPSVFTRWVFLRLLGGIYLAAFASAAYQIDGLIGSKGILPVGRFFDAARGMLGSEAHWVFPSLLWIDPSDAALHGLCVAGILFSVVSMIGLVPIVATATLWLLYLSLVSGGQVFFGYQWDALLLEAGFLAILYSPGQLFLSRQSKHRPSPLVVLLYRLLLFRLMFSSGVAKLGGGDTTWLHFTALNFHYFTQPLPPWTAWYFQHLPKWFGAISVGFTFFAEIAAPLMTFGPRRIRLCGFWLILILQTLIVLTGNFGCFNLLAGVLCLPLLDDADWPMRWRRRFTAPLAARQRWMIPIAIVIGALGVLRLIDGIDRPIQWPWPVPWLDRLQLVNRYGLFTEMTTSRYEIDVQGSDDGMTWKSYGFRWKPGDPQRPPAFCIPDMPRLDWQMWFAALGDVQQNRWFVEFLRQLLNGSKPVLALLQDNPFPDRPPHYVRALMKSYRFTTPAERAATGDWWHCDPAGIYCPAVSLRQ